MTRLTAKERSKISTKAPVAPAISVPTGVTQVARHLICTQCGLVALEERYRNGPYESKSRIQRYGGSLVSPTGRMGDRPGVIIWELPEDLTAADIQLLLEKLAQAQDLLKGMTPAVPKPPPLPSAPPQIPVVPPAPPKIKAEEIVEALEKKWRDAKARNSKLAEADLDELEMRWGYDVEEAREKLQEYKDTDRADFESAEEYSEARADAWQEFVDSIDTISKEEEEEIKAAPPKPKPPKKVVKPPEKPEEKVITKQLTQAAIKLLTAEAKAHAKELAKIKGDIRRKVFIIELWEKECKRNPDSLACQAYMKLSDEQREALLTNVLNALMP